MSGDRVTVDRADLEAVLKLVDQNCDATLWHHVRGRLRAALTARERDSEDRVEELQRACEGIYREFDGYWPNESERARIAVALLEVGSR